nr:RNA/RNP complex-1-interacting phosphatase homolog [Nomia melanderi]
MTNMPKSVPARWLDYKPFGTIINGTKILPFKVPLKETVCNNLEPEQRFTTSILVQAFPRLKCIVDLTNTDRYYHGKEFTSRGIRYEKIWVRGREVPSMNEVKKFFKLMDDFLSTSAEEDIIGVHCTHGINRSGYLICRYLVQQLGWDPEECIKTNRTPGGSRLPPGPPSRLPKPKMPPPPPPPPSRLRPTVLRRLQTQKRKQHIRNSIVTLIKNRSSIFKQDSQSSRSLPKLLKEQDFTVDTFEENLLAISGHPHRRPTKGRFSQAK